MATTSQRLKFQKNLLLWCFLILPTILLGLFVITPLGQLFRYSFTDWDGISKDISVIGLENFKKVFTELPQIWISLKNNALYFFIHLLIIPLEIVVAYLLSKSFRGNDFFKKMILLPYIINGVAVSYIFSTFFGPAYANGALNIILEKIGLSAFANDWLGDAKTVNYCLVFVSVWRFSGFHIILFIAGMQSIPSELFEAAVIDGANEPYIVRKIVIPSIITVIEIVLFLNVRGALQVFDIPFIMTNGGPGHASSTFTLYTIQMAFRFNQYGIASAMAVNLFFLIIIVAGIQKLIFGRSND